MNVVIVKPLVLGNGKAFDAGEKADLDKHTAAPLIAAYLAVPETQRKSETATSKKLAERRVL